MADETVGRRERKKRATRQAIRRAALELALDRGVENLTIEEISETADVAPRTFFNYFSCKEDALVGESPEARQEIREAIAARPADEPPLETLRAVLKDIAVTHTEHEHREEAVLRQRLVDGNPVLLPRQLARYATFEQLLAETMAERTGTDPERELRPALLAAVGVMACRVAIKHWAEGNGRPVGELIDEAFDLLEGGLSG